eukprot:g2138.t1
MAVFTDFFSSLSQKFSSHSKCSTTVCSNGLEAQELCEYNSKGCDWTGHNCDSQMNGCVCPKERNFGLKDSLIELFTKENGPLSIMTAYVLLVSCALTLLALHLLNGYLPPKKWSRGLQNSTLHPISGNVIRIWLTLCTAATVCLVLFSIFAGPDIWPNGCSNHVCVYHQMFCEATRHSSVVRHPANFWSNLPYLYISLFLVIISVDDLWVKQKRRPYIILDCIFGFVLMGMAIASFVWHGSNCTDIHFVDIGLMNSTIAFFPLRFSLMAIASLLNISEVGLPFRAFSSILYSVCVLLLFTSAYGKTELYHEAFPTGRSRTGAEFAPLSQMDIILYIGLPGLYVVPAIFVAYLRKHWGCVKVIHVAQVALVIAFFGHSCEKLVVDLYCYPMSLFLQPTANFHFWSGIAIACAYIEGRALEVGNHSKRKKT